MGESHQQPGMLCRLCDASIQRLEKREHSKKVKEIKKKKRQTYANSFKGRGKTK
jgi:hypothetical protein